MNSFGPLLVMPWAIEMSTLDLCPPEAKGYWLTVFQDAILASLETPSLAISLVGLRM